MDYLVHHRFITSRERCPDKPCVGDERGWLTYQETADRAGFLAQQLVDVGVRRGDRVAFYLDHDREQALALLATWAVGGVCVPIAGELFPAQVAHILQDAAARVLLTTSARRQALAEVLPKCTELESVHIIGSLDGSAPLERTRPCIEQDLAALLYTSGSTGRPKGVMLSHRNLLAGGDIVSDYLGLVAEDRLLGVLPLSFDYGLNQLLTMWGQGGTYRFLRFRLPNDIVSALAAEAITGLAGVPPLWALLARSSLGRIALPHLRYITNSGGAMPTAVLAMLRRALPTTKIFLMYGLTEAFRSTYLPPEELDRRPTSMGRAIPNTEILVLSADGRPCAPREVGELVHRGPTVALGYWRRPDETAERFRPSLLHEPAHCAGELVVFSGDLVKTDDDGFLYFVGRRDGMIKCSGHRISPVEIEEVVFKTGLAKEAAAVGVSDDAAGQTIRLFAVPIDEYGRGNDEFARTIIDYCARNLPTYMVPREVATVSALPRTSSGKVDYASLRKVR